MRGARNSSRGTEAIASSTRSSVTPCGRSCSATIRCAGVLISVGLNSESTISTVSLASSSLPTSVPQKWRRPVRQRSRLVRRTGPAHSRVEFAHPSEQEFARFLDYYRIRWMYEPVSFPIAWEGTRVAEMFTPDFYLPEHDLYIELTTMKQSLVTPKNRKLRMVRELYPELNVRLLYRRTGSESCATSTIRSKAGTCCWSKTSSTRVSRSTTCCRSCAAGSPPRSRS